MKPFKMQIADKIGRILTDYENAVTLTGQRYAVAHEDFKKNLGTGKYTADYCRELFRAEVDRFLAEFYDVAGNLDVQLNKAIASAKTSALEGLTVTDDSAAYYSRLNYAHTLIREEGKTIDDQTAFDFIGDFKHDLKQMHIFFRMIDRQIDDRTRLLSFMDPTLDVLPSGAEHAAAVEAFGGGGSGEFPLTFAYMNHCDKVLAVLDEMASLATGLLTHKLAEKNEYYFIGERREDTIFAPQISLTPAMKIAELRSKAMQVELMLDVMEKIGDFDE